MYFDVDQQVEMPQGRFEDCFASAAREICTRNGRVIAVSRDILLFSAPFLRANGLLCLFVKQLPLGVSHGVFQVMAKNSVCVVRYRVSLFWLRVCIAAILLVVMGSIVTPGASDKWIAWAFFLASIVLAGIIYAVCVVRTRRYFTKMLLGRQADGDCIK